MWKSNCPLNLITGCATLCSNNCSQAFAVTGYESFTSLWRHFCPLFCAELFQFSHIGGLLSMKGLFKVMPQHLNRIWVRTLTWPLQNLNFVFPEPFRGGLAGVFGIIVLLFDTQVCLRSQTDGRTFSFRIFWYNAQFMVPSIMASCAGPGAAKPQTITLPPPSSPMGPDFFLKLGPIYTS